MVTTQNLVLYDMTTKEPITEVFVGESFYCSDNTTWYIGTMEEFLADNNPEEQDMLLEVYSETQEEADYLDEMFGEYEEEDV